MEYRRLGRSGLKVSELSYGSYVTFGKQMGIETVKECMRYAFDNGINFFDTAEVYENGVAESLMGEALREFRRDEFVVSTKIFWSGEKPNQTGLSRKHLIEATKNSLKRMKLDYVDLIYAHRPDPETPVEETVLAMDYLVRNGFAFYWGTSMWPAEKIIEAYEFAKINHCIAPTMEQPVYNILSREIVENELAEVIEKYSIGLTTFAPLSSGILTGKYANGKVPKGTRFDVDEWCINKVKNGVFTQDLLIAITELSKIAKEIGCTLSQLSLAWCMKNKNVSSVIFGASSVDQMKENIKASEIKKLLDDTVMNKINSVVSKLKEKEEK
ncbi:MAG TPA: aldo/keto reductase [bacterium]|nr:aldo/keto reductase [bacterium]